jgi:hypothetical protein
MENPLEDEMGVESEEAEGHIKEEWIFGPHYAHLRMHGSVYYNPSNSYMGS